VENHIVIRKSCLKALPAWPLENHLQNLVEKRDLPVSLKILVYLMKFKNPLIRTQKESQNCSFSCTLHTKYKILGTYGK